jgi:aryl-alcohol dehydrogenase-like predicted oxidoreductase
VVLAKTGDPAVMGQQANEKAQRWREAARTALPLAIDAGVRIATEPTSMEHLRENLAAAELELGPEDAGAINELVPETW